MILYVNPNDFPYQFRKLNSLSMECRAISAGIGDDDDDATSNSSSFLLLLLFFYFDYFFTYLWLFPNEKNRTRTRLFNKYRK